MSDLEDLRDRFREFARERDWEQFHDPRSLILALVGEVGELAELFQWPTAGLKDANRPGSQLNMRAAEEVSDILLYLIRLGDVLNIDLTQSANAKLDAAHTKYPVPESNGIAPNKLARPS